MPPPKRFELAIYNETVKKSVREGDPNKTGLSDDWADVRYVEVSAETPELAKARLHSRYPAIRGFVILEVRQLD
jgi:hypothetical protein